VFSCGGGEQQTIILAWVITVESVIVSELTRDFLARGTEIMSKDCKKLPHAARRHIEEVDEILGLLTQSHISRKNLERLTILIASSDEEVANLAKVVSEIGEIRPYKRRRLKVLANEHKDLFARLEELELLEVMRPY
jgi:succinate dehydrogenase flavin-adding protein (antitoxin of CptAB toxin-antitoxin module)